MTPLIRRRAMMKQGSRYTFYDWIARNDNDRTTYIDTEYNVHRATIYAFEGSFARLGNIPRNYNNYYIFCTTTGTDASGLSFAICGRNNTTGGLISFNYNSRPNGGTYAGKPTTDINVGEWHTFDLHATDGVTYGGTLTLDGVDTSWEGAYINPATLSIKLLVGYPAKLGRFKIYENDVLMADLIPATDAGGNIGVYDVVRDAFYTPTGDASLFSIGNNT